MPVRLVWLVVLCALAFPALAQTGGVPTESARLYYKIGGGEPVSATSRTCSARRSARASPA